MKIDHVRLLVTNFAECYRFYRDIIGLTVKWGKETDSYASFTEEGSQAPNLAIYDRQLMADVLGTGQLASDVSSQDHSMLIIGVEDVDQAAEQFRRLGIELVLEPQDFPDWGMRGAYLRDPDGNLIELAGELPRERWSASLREEAKQYE